MLAILARDIWTALLPLTLWLCIIPTSTTLALAQPVSGSFSTRAGNTLDSPDESKNLPIQIGGIVASYVIFDAVVVFLLLLVGRRLRREAHSSNYSLEMVMLGPSNKYAGSLYPSPSSDYTIDSQFPSPDKPRGWNMSWPSVRSHKANASMNSSVATIDESVVSADRRRAQEEMEYLYAHVMEHDAKKASPQSSPVMDNGPRSPASSETPLASPAVSIQPPPQYQYQTPLSPRQGSTATTKSRTSKRLSKLSNLSIFSPSSRSSSHHKLKSPHSIRDLPISPPVKSPDPVQIAPYQGSQPMSPRIYDPGPPPTAPLPLSSSQGSNIQSPRGFTLQPLATPSSVVTARAAPPPLTINNNYSNYSNNGSNSTLPFRQQFNVPLSAPYTKTTILERPFNASSGGPRTGMPTPYSPYMPFTPVTPITPSRLVTKRDRKKMSRSNGLKVLHEDDLVKNDEDLWGT